MTPYDNKPLLSLRDLKVHFPLKAQWPWQTPAVVKAVDGVSFDLYPGETLGIVGESGCGKSTLLRSIMQLVPVTGGQMLWMGKNVLGRQSQAETMAFRRDVQMIFQDPLASLNPRMTISEIIAEPLLVHKPNISKKERLDRVVAMMERVGLRSQMINRYPHEFSGGQCQRIGIARALILEPKLILCDEPVSALDVSIQAQIVNLLQDLRKEMGLTLIFVAHDLAVVKHISHRILVLYLGREMELAPKEVLYENPQHPYTKALLSAIPIPDPALERHKQVQMLSGDLPSPLNPPSGCVFRTRCPRAQAECAQAKLELLPVAGGSLSSCIFNQKPT